MAILKRQSQHSDPFSVSLRRYFYTPELKQRLNLIIHLLQNSEQLLLVLAEAGLGKSAFLSQLKKSILAQYSNWWVYTLHAHPALSPEVLYSTLLTAFHGQPANKPLSILQQAVRNHIASTRYSGQLPILLVDDAHRLPLATLGVIADLCMQGGAQSKLRVILFAQPQITSLLATPDFQSLQNSLIHTLDIPALTQLQTRDYLQFRLENTHYHSLQYLFKSDQLKKIYAESGGVPADIHAQAQVILQYYSKQTQFSTLDSPTLRGWLLWIIPLLILLCALILILYQNHSPFLFGQQYSAPSPPPLTLKQGGGERSPPLSLQGNAETASSPADSSQKIKGDKTSSLLSPQVEAEARPVPSSQIGLETQPPSQLLSADLEFKDANWLRQQPPHHYTLQLLGAYQLSTLRQFIQRHSLPLQDLVVFKTSFQHKDWYILILGIYPSYAAAQNAQQQLSPSVRQHTQPWIRKLENIHITQQ